MSEVTKAHVDEKAGKLMKLTMPLRSTDIPQRIQSYVFNQTGKKLTEYIGDLSIPFAEKAELLDKLVAILESKDYSELPTAPNGQAQTPPVAPAKGSAPTAKPTPAVPKPAAPAPAPALSGAQAAIEAAKKRRAEAAAAAAAAATKAEPGITEERVKEIVAEAIAAAEAEFEKKIHAHIEARLTWAIEQLAA